MGKIHIPEKVNLVIGLIFNDIEQCRRVIKNLVKKFGRIDFESDTLGFNKTDYYKEEMGGPLKRKFLSFKYTIDLKDIYKIKLDTNLLEKRFSKSGRRTVNIDPGYLNLSKLVLFSTKDYFHRIYLNKGIYAEVTLFYRDKTFSPLAWTYPDYKSGSYINIFNSVRQIYKEKISC